MAKKKTQDFKGEYYRIKAQGGIAFPEAMVKAWLAQRGVRVPVGRVARTADEASKIGAGIGYPVVIKVSSDRMLHKTESGAVKLGVKGPGELRREFGDMRARANDSMRHQGFEGVLVEEQVPPGVEMIVGLQNDPHFGPVLMVGMGGILTDLLEDVAFRMLPVARRDVREMLRGLKGRALLGGFRVAEPCDVQAL